MSLDRRGLVIIQDGLGDWPIVRLGNRTPLEAAQKPNMDSLIAEGAAGLVDIVAPGVKVETDIGHLALFGQDPVHGYSGRGPLEAAGVGLRLNEGEVAFRCNFATVDASGLVVDRRAGRIRETVELAAALDGLKLGPDVGLTFRGATDHRAVLVLRGPGLSPAVSDSDPRREGKPVRSVVALDATPEAERTARIVNRFLEESRRILGSLPLNRVLEARGIAPANCVLTRGGGGSPSYENIAEKFSIRVACVSGEATVLGIAQLSGFDTLFSDALTANVDTNLSRKAQLAVQALLDHDLVYLHVKGCDIMGHDNRPIEKTQFIEKTDAMVGELLGKLADRRNLCIAFVADHCTPCEIGEHTGDPVPVFIHGPGIETDSVTSYGERSCARGRLGRLRAVDFLQNFFELLGFSSDRQARTWSG